MRQEKMRLFLTCLSRSLNLKPDLEPKCKSKKSKKSKKNKETLLVSINSEVCT